MYCCCGFHLRTQNVALNMAEQIGRVWLRYDWKYVSVFVTCALQPKKNMVLRLFIFQMQSFTQNQELQLFQSRHSCERSGRRKDCLLFLKTFTGLVDPF
jgi:hypothetical protein